MHLAKDGNYFNEDDNKCFKIRQSLLALHLFIITIEVLVQ